MTAMPDLTHLSPTGQADMVDVSGKAVTERIAIAEGQIVMQKATLDLALSGNAKKGDVFAAARIAAIMAAKKAHDLIPLCHPLALTKVTVDLEPDPRLTWHKGPRAGQGAGPDRCRNGSADRRFHRLPDDL